ncbi:MAG: hypothetical protein P8176_11920, partial [Gammaproteobacteria bacterium]
MRINPVKPRVVRRVAVGVDVGVTDRPRVLLDASAEGARILRCRAVLSFRVLFRVIFRVMLFGFFCVVHSLWAAVLPEEKVEVLYHQYAESDQDINGPAVLVQKRIGKKYSLTYSHLVDRVTGASVDVRLYASPYVETRKENTLSATHLFPKGTFSVG